MWLHEEQHFKQASVPSSLRAFTKDCALTIHGSYRRAMQPAPRCRLQFLYKCRFSLPFQGSETSCMHNESPSIFIDRDRIILMKLNQFPALPCTRLVTQSTEESKGRHVITPHVAAFLPCYLSVSQLILSFAADRAFAIGLAMQPVTSLETAFPVRHDVRRLGARSVSADGPPQFFTHPL
jgi:hypothetical protein